jgi:hypothetical protein
VIIRRHDTNLLLITQPDHAALAGRIMSAWRADDLETRPTRARVLHATSDHDLGWQLVDASPSVDPASGEPHDFVTSPLELKQGVWSRALDQLAPQDSYVAALVAHHAATVYRRFLSTSGWETFFRDMERRRDEWLTTQPFDRSTFLRDYAIVSVGDLCSLMFCSEQREPQSREGYRTALHEGHWLEITPDPFQGATIPMEVPARRIPARRYVSDADLRDTVARAPIVQLTGVAAGFPPDRGRAS